MSRWFHCLLLVALVTSIAMTAGCQEKSNKETFSEISDRLAEGMDELDSQPGIRLTGYAANPDDNLFKIGIEYDSTLITNAQLKEIIVDYLSSAASNSPTEDWREMLKPYRVRIEKLGDKTTFPVIAEKQSDETELEWER
ncbi:hypothetical protein ACFO9Q_01485 [Paenibacillus sp. GCM10023252]|uniref:hypothetical protein n=1 Tax=Paenibacillus sp. GCM10023252 TaxID=3252649 RepID=UPI003618E26B